MPYSTIKMKELFPKWEKRGSNDVFLDVRRADEFAYGRVPGALHIPYDQISTRLAELNPATTLYVYCAAGARSLRASDDLVRAGFKQVVCVIESGMADWAVAGYPVER